VRYLAGYQFARKVKCVLTLAMTDSCVMRKRTAIQLCSVLCNFTSCY